MSDTKICSHCKLDLKFSEYGPRGDGTPAKHSICRVCRSLYNAERLKPYVPTGRPRGVPRGTPSPLRGKPRPLKDRKNQTPPV